MNANTARQGCFGAERVGFSDDQAAARALSAPAVSAEGRTPSALRRAAQPDNRQMDAAVYAFEFDVEASVGSADDEGLRLRAGLGSAPLRPWLDPRSSVGGKRPEVDLVRRFAAQRGVRTVFVVLGDHESQCVAHSTVRYNFSAGHLPTES